MLDLTALDFTKGDGLVTVVAQDAATGAVLMVAHADREAVERTIATGEMHYRSRTRGLWHKGATSGNVQRVQSLAPDCDGDAILARVTPAGPACHTGAETCFEPAPGECGRDSVRDAAGEASPGDASARETRPEERAAGLFDAGSVASGTLDGAAALRALDATIAARAGAMRGDGGKAGGAAPVEAGAVRSGEADGAARGEAGGPRESGTIARGAPPQQHDTSTPAPDHRPNAPPATEPVRPSYTARLLADRNLRMKKLGEEAAELVLACADEDRPRAVEEAGDLFYHTLVALRALGLGLDDVAAVLARRAR